MVAANINQSDKNERNLTVRETTLMPNIRGFGPLMALIFCPLMEVKLDSTKSRYVSMITGLGYNHAMKMPVFEEHDSIFHLNVELTPKDIQMVRGNSRNKPKSESNQPRKISDQSNSIQFGHAAVHLSKSRISPEHNTRNQKQFDNQNQRVDNQVITPLHSDIGEVTD